jgi:surface protein
MKKLLYLFLTVLIVGCSSDDNNNDDNSNDLQKEWLYTHTALEATATSSTTIVIPFTEDIFAFTDRPNREFKYISGDEFASYWNDYDDANSFKLDPPNAVLTWVDADGVSEVEVVITDANFDGNNMIYTIENTTITANQSFEDVSLFVDGNGSNNAVYLASNGVTVKASAGAQNNEQGGIGNITFTVVNLETLKFEISQEGDVSTLVTSLVTDMSELFNDNTTFNQDISSWDTSNVTNMESMFAGATSFNQDISSWSVDGVTDCAIFSVNSSLTEANTPNFTNCDPNLAIGQSCQGGIVAYIDSTGQHGLIAATEDQSEGILWWNGSYVVTGATGTAIGTGLTNTNAIIAAQGSGSYAASIARDYNGGGYTDWFLPSKDELNKLYENKTAIGGFTDDFYWSSTESEYNGAWVWDFGYGAQSSNLKDYPSNVRAVRAF